VFEFICYVWELIESHILFGLNQERNKFLLFLNSDNFTFVFSLLWFVLSLLFFSFSLLFWSGVLLLHYFIFWKKIKPYLDLKFQTEKDNAEMREIITEVKNKLRLQK